MNLPWAAQYLAQHDIPVISGLAKGIDGYAHTACLKAGGYTIAFLGNGIGISYPKEHDELLQGIIGNGVVISEYPPNTKTRPEYFPRRNSLISSWSHKLLIVEAAEKSGALTTAGHGKLQGRKVFVPPHEIYCSTGQGTNQLLEEGATLYLRPSQLLLRMDPKESSVGTDSLENRKIVGKKNTSISGQIPGSGLTSVEEQIRKILINSVKTIEQIGKDTGIHQVNLIELLSIMELEGIIESIPGGKFRLKQNCGTRDLSLCPNVTTPVATTIWDKLSA